MPVRRCLLFLYRSAPALDGVPLRHMLASDGSLFSAHLWLEPAQLAFDGHLSSYGFTTDAGRHVSTHFCGRCGTTLWFEAEVTPGLKALCAGTLDNPNEWTRPGRELFCVNKPDFLELDIAETHDTQPF